MSELVLDGLLCGLSGLHSIRDAIAAIATRCGEGHRALK